MLPHHEECTTAYKKKIIVFNETGEFASMLRVYILLIFKLKHLITLSIVKMPLLILHADFCLVDILTPLSETTCKVFVCASFVCAS